MPRTTPARQARRRLWTPFSEPQHIRRVRRIDAAIKKEAKSYGYMSQSFGRSFKRNSDWAEKRFLPALSRAFNRLRHLTASIKKTPSMYGVQTPVWVYRNVAGGSPVPWIYLQELRKYQRKK